MPAYRIFLFLSTHALVIGLTVGCGTNLSNRTADQNTNTVIASVESTQNEDALDADFSILFFGNSHTYIHDIPHLVEKLIRHRFPDKMVAVQYYGISFLDELAQQPSYREELRSKRWNHVVLQAQKISMSGKFNYSQSEGIEFAKLAASEGMKAIFYSEWGRKNVFEDGLRTERIYQVMADDSNADVAPVGRAWDIALAARPELELHAQDGNHQAQLGAFLSACVLVGCISGEDPTSLGGYSCFEIAESDRRFLAQCAAKAILQKAEASELRPSQQAP